MGKQDADPEPSFSTDKDLNEVWPEVIAEYERVTEKKLDSSTTFESFQQTVNEKLREATSKRTSHARTVLNNVGTCLQQFGSIIADGASMAFGPSAQCWNAINFVIIAAQKYSGVFDGFVTLMERCAAFLSRLNIYLKQELGKAEQVFPSHLRKPAYEILGHFINVLKSSYKLSTSKREKFKLVLDIVLFSGDAGVQSSLDLLEKQIQDFTHVQIDQILVDVKGLARYLKESDEVRQRHQSEIREHMEQLYKVGEETLAVAQMMKTSLDGRVSQEKNKDDLEKIRKAFDLKADFDTWTKRHDHLCKVRIQDSSRWLVERDDLGFIPWANAQDHKAKARILTVEGDPGFGKTFISNKVISNLQDIYRKNSNVDRVLIAYYYYGENKQNGEDQDDSLERCIRCIIYQFALADPAYARAVAEVCQNSSGIARAAEIWNVFLTKLQHAMKGTYYICIDGLASETAGEVITTIAQSVLSEVNSVSIRLYFSGTNQIMAKVPQDDDGVRRILLGPVKDLGKKMVRLSADEINDASTLVPLVNASDLEAVARARIEELGKKKPDLKTVMTHENIKKLVAGVQGHYDYLEAKMIQINACDSESKIHEIINSIGDDLKTSIRNSLKMFSESLNAEQIRQLNELLVWVVGGRNNSVEFLQSALFHAFGRTFLLRDLIATTFAGFLTLDETAEYSFVRIKSDQVLEILREDNQSHLRLTRPGNTAVELTQAEIDLCSHIVKNVCGEHVYGRFNFDDFFNSLTGKQRATVQVDEELPLDVTVARSLLRVLCEENDDEKLRPLRRYASYYFYEHLVFVEKLDYFEPDRESLTDIGSKLSTLLYEPSTLVEVWLKENLLDAVSGDFVGRDDSYDYMIKLLRNYHAAIGYKQDVNKAKWVESVIDPKASKYVILERVASSVAKKWFDCKGLIDPSLVWFSYGLFSKIKWGTYESKTPSLASISEYLDWVLEHTALDKNEPRWLSRVGSMYLLMDYYESALIALKESETVLGDNWIVQLRIADAHAGLKQFSTALEYLHKIKANSSQIMDNDKVFKDVYWERVVLPEGNYHRELKDHNAAIKCFQEVLAQDADEAKSFHSDALASIFALWMEIGESDEIITFLKEKGAAGNLSYWLGEVIRARDDLHSNIIHAAKRSSTVKEVSRMYDVVIETKTESNNTTNDKEESTKAPNSVDVGYLEYLRFFRALLDFHGSEQPHEHEKALETWERIASNPSNRGDAYWVVYKACRLLARALLDKGVAGAAPDSYLARLEALSKSNNHSIRQYRQSQYDPKFCLARLYILTDKIALANEEAKNLLRGVFDNWPEDLDDPSLPMRYGILARVLAVFNLDEDAVAAWQALKPRQISTTSGEGYASKVSTESLGNMPERSHIPKAEAYLNDYICDSCSTVWDAMLADCWDCKHCLCVQLCTTCHDKLLADQLSLLVCSKEHEFVYIPKFDEERWATLPDDHIVVGGKSVPRAEWLNQFRERWSVQQEQIDSYKLETARKMKAAFCIAKYGLRWKRRRSQKQKMKRAKTFPAINNH